MVRLRGDSGIEKDSSLLLAFIMCKVLGDGDEESVNKINRAFYEMQENSKIRNNDNSKR